MTDPVWSGADPDTGEGTTVCCLQQIQKKQPVQMDWLFYYPAGSHILSKSIA